MEFLERWYANQLEIAVVFYQLAPRLGYRIRPPPVADHLVAALAKPGNDERSLCGELKVGE